MFKKLLVCFILIMFCVVVSAGCGGGGSSGENESNENGDFHEPEIDRPYENESDDQTGENLVTDEMKTASYWLSFETNPDEILLNSSKIESMNEQILEEAKEPLENGLVDFDSIKSLSDLDEPSYVPYSGNYLLLDGKEFDADALISEFKSQEMKLNILMYAVAVRRTSVLEWPTSQKLTLSSRRNTLLDDTVEENFLQFSILEVNEPIILNSICFYGGKTWYYARTKTVKGWVNGEDIALFTVRSDWENAWKVQYGARDFVVVTGDETLKLSDGTSLKVAIGTILKANNFDDNGNLIVTIPTRSNEGWYVGTDLSINLLEKNYSVGYVPFTKKNLLEIAFGQIGKFVNSNGDNLEIGASMFLKNLFKCFGIQLPEYNWSNSASSINQNISEKTTDEKNEIISGLPVGTIIYSNDYPIIYIGTTNGLLYGLSALSVYSDWNFETEESENAYPHEVIVMPLDVQYLTTIPCTTNVSSYIDYSKF